MIDELFDRLNGVPVVPPVQSNDPDTPIKITRALVEGGLTVIEVVLRTESGNR